jgi:hypothetical protein
MARPTGIESAVRWISARDEKPIALQAPEFYFELELRRLAAELHPLGMMKPPAKGSDGLEDYTQHTTELDLTDFHEAIEKKLIQPADAKKAEGAHEAMRDLIDSAKEDDPEPALPAEIPSEFADYHRGALAFQRGKKDEAEAAWKKLFERPAAERHYRSTWAAYMLGKMANEAKDWDSARSWFQKTRTAAKDGLADSLGLVSASLGWEAYADLQDEKLGDAARLYLEQLASGDVSAVNSLRVVMEEAFKDGADLAALASDPVLQRIGIAGAVAGMTPFSGFYGNEPADDLGMRWLKALEAVDAKNVRDADRIAWIAYTRGQYPSAQRWLARADAEGPYALWLKAKFALREGKIDAATKLLARAVEKLPTERRVEAYSIWPSAIPPRDSAYGDLALLRLNRSEFMEALRMFLEGGLYSDAFYLADGVLTIDELKTFLEKEGPKLPKVRDYPWEPADEQTAKEEAGKPEPVWHFYYYNDPQKNLRGILASRLIRAGRYAEARPYLEMEAQGFLDELVAKLDQAKAKGASKAQQAEALWEAALLIREHGSDLADYFDPVTMAERTNGRTVDTSDSSVIAFVYEKPVKIVPPVSSGELQRLKKNAVPQLRRYYSTYLAADLGWRSAALMPDNDEKTAERLNQAGTWLKIGDDKAADRFIQAIERRCTKTEIGKQVLKKHWFVPVAE